MIVWVIDESKLQKGVFVIFKVYIENTRNYLSLQKQTQVSAEPAQFITLVIVRSICAACSMEASLNSRLKTWALDSMEPLLKLSWWSESDRNKEQINMVGHIHSHAFIYFLNVYIACQNN